MTVAGAGRLLSAGIGNFPVCVDVMMVPFGILTRTPGLALLRLLVMSVGCAKCPVAPVSRTKVRCGEGDRLNADDNGFSLLLLFLPPSHDRHVLLGFPPLTASFVVLPSCVVLMPLFFGATIGARMIRMDKVPVGPTVSTPVFARCLCLLLCGLFLELRDFLT